MKLSYDPRHNVAYIRPREKTAEVETIRVSDELNVDVAPNGTVYASSCSTPTSSCARATIGVSWSSRRKARSGRWRSPRTRTPDQPASAAWTVRVLG